MMTDFLSLSTLNNSPVIINKAAYNVKLISYIARTFPLCFFMMREFSLEFSQRALNTTRVSAMTHLNASDWLLHW